MLKAHASVTDTRSLIFMKINFGHQTVNAVGVKSQTIYNNKSATLYTRIWLYGNKSIFSHTHTCASDFYCDIDFNGDYSLTLSQTHHVDGPSTEIYLYLILKVCLHVPSMSPFFVRFKNRFHAVPWCCLYTTLKISKVPLTYKRTH